MRFWPSLFHSLVAWGFIAADGSIYESFNVAASTNLSEGEYRITVNSSFTSTDLVPMAIPELDFQPTTASTYRMATINSGTSSSNFLVYINNGTFAPTNSDFTFIVTGR